MSSQKIPLAEIAEAQGVDINEFRYVCDIWLCLLYLVYILCFLNYFLPDRQCLTVKKKGGMVWIKLIQQLNAAEETRRV